MDEKSPLQKRTAKACTTCHARKTRCDALSAGLPCSHCREGGFECLFQPRKKRRSKLALRMQTSNQQSMCDAGGGGQRGMAVQGKSAVPSGHTISTGGPDGPGPSTPVALPEHVMRHQIPHFSFFSRLALVGRASAPLTRTVTTGGDDARLVLPIAAHNQSADGQAYDSQARAEDELFLRQKGAFTLPPRETLDDCVSTYFSVFHPFFPVVDRPAFLSHYRSTPTEDLVKTGRGPSLLLLQSIVFTASAFVSTASLTAMGFASRHQARSVLHSRAKHLHQFSWEPDDIATIQSLLLMSHYYASMADQRHTWLWAHQAISLAQGAGLHREGAGGGQNMLWKRIWWACLVRDRLISLGTRRPMHINSLDCSVPLPTADDLGEDGDTDDDRATKAIFADFLKLCHYVEGVLSLSYVANGQGDKDADRLASEVALCRSTLENWAANLSPASRRGVDTEMNRPSNTDSPKDGPAPGSIPFLYCTLLHLMHNVVLTTLLQTGGSMYHDPLAGLRVPSTEMQALAQDSTLLLDGLIRRDLVKYCPTQIVTAVMPALIVQFLLMRGEAGENNADAARGFTTCMAALGQLGATYWHAQFYHDFFQLAAAAGRRVTARAVKKARVGRRGRTGKSTVPTRRSPAGISPTAATPSTLAEGVSPVETSNGHANVPLVSQSENFDPASVDPLHVHPPAHPPHDPPQLGSLDLLPAQLEPAWPPGTWDTEQYLGEGNNTDNNDNMMMDTTLWESNNADGLWTDQVTLFDDWLNDDALFQSLFPSA